MLLIFTKFCSKFMEREPQVEYSVLCGLSNFIAELNALIHMWKK
jgi:hypothetical protein